MRPEEYRAGYLPQAISIPLEELEGRLSDLPKRKKVIAYCRGMMWQAGLSVWLPQPLQAHLAARRAEAVTRA